METSSNLSHLDEWFSAAITGNEEFINKHASDYARTFNQDGKTALMLAGELGMIGILAILAPLEAGILSKEERYALEYAILKERVESIPTLLHYENCYMKTLGKDPLLFALQNQSKESALAIIALSKDDDSLDYNNALELATAMAYHDVVGALQCKLEGNSSVTLEPIRPTISGVTKIDGTPATYVTADGRNLTLSMSVSFGDASRSCSLAPRRPRQIDYDFLLYSKDQEILRLQTLLIQISNNMKIKIAHFFAHTHDTAALDDVDKLQSDLAAAMLTIDELNDKLEQQKSIASLSAPVPDIYAHVSDNKSSFIGTQGNEPDEVKDLRRKVYILTETVNELEDKLRLSTSTTDIAERKVTERIFAENMNLRKTVQALSGKLDSLSKSVPQNMTDETQWSHASHEGFTVGSTSIESMPTNSISTKLSVGLPRSSTSGAVAMSPGQKLANIALSHTSPHANASSPLSSDTSKHIWAYHSDKMITHIDVSTPTQAKRTAITRPRAPARRNTQWYAEQMKRVRRAQC